MCTIFYHCKKTVRYWGFRDAVHVLYSCLQDALDMFRHSDAYLAFCNIIESHTKLVMHAALTDG